MVAKYPNRREYDYNMVEFLDRTIETFDGLTNQNGKIVYTSHLVYDYTTLDIRNNNVEMVLRLEPTIPKELERLVEKQSKHLGSRSGSFT